MSVHLIDLALVLPLKSAVHHILLTEHYSSAFKKNSHCKTCAAFLLALGIVSMKYISLIWFLCLLKNSFVG